MKLIHRQALRYLIVAVLIAGAWSIAPRGEGMGRRWKTPTPTPTPRPTPTTTPTPAVPTGTPRAIGLLGLFPSYKDPSKPPPDPARSATLTNSLAQGVLWRETWQLIEKSPDQYDWSFLDKCFAASSGKGKIAALQILHSAGDLGPPQWLIDQGATMFLGCTVPWDPIFQQKWEKFQTAMAARYKDRADLVYVVTAGQGHSSESFFVRSTEDETAANDLAKKMGYADLNEAWTKGTKWIIDMYLRVWGNKAIVYTTGAPFPTDGQDAQTAVVQYGHAQSAIRFGVRPNNLGANSPGPQEPSVALVAITAPTCQATGFQYGQSQSDATALDAALKRGIGYGAHYQELFENDLNDPLSVPALTDALHSMGVSTAKP